MHASCHLRRQYPGQHCATLKPPYCAPNLRSISQSSRTGSRATLAAPQASKGSLPSIAPASGGTSHERRPSRFASLLTGSGLLPSSSGSTLLGRCAPHCRSTQPEHAAGTEATEPLCLAAAPSLATCRAGQLWRQSQPTTLAVQLAPPLHCRWCGDVRTESLELQGGAEVGLGQLESHRESSSKLLWGTASAPLAAHPASLHAYVPNRPRRLRLPAAAWQPQARRRGCQHGSDGPDSRGGA